MKLEYTDGCICTSLTVDGKETVDMTMERKIGEIFEYNGEWYQCIKGNCAHCSIQDEACEQRILNDVCKPNRIFKKLEKVGEPFTLTIHVEDRLVPMQEYKLYDVNFCKENALLMYVSDYKHKRIAIEIKQNKEDMEENKTPLPKEDNPLTRVVYAYVNGKISDNELIKSIKEMSDEYPYNKNNIKPFSLEATKAGKPVCTRDGRKARIICFDRVDAKPILALVASTDGKGENVFDYFVSGKRIANALESDLDLMMPSEKKEGWVNISNCPDNGYSNYDSGVIVFKTKEEAINFTNNKDYIDTVKVTWEE